MQKCIGIYFKRVRSKNWISVSKKGREAKGNFEEQKYLYRHAFFFYRLIPDTYKNAFDAFTKVSEIKNDINNWKTSSSSYLDSPQASFVGN